MVKVCSAMYIKVLYVLCLYKAQISGECYRTIGPLVSYFSQNIDCGFTLEPPQ